MKRGCLDIRMRMCWHMPCRMPCWELPHWVTLEHIFRIRIQSGRERIPANSLLRSEKCCWREGS